MATIKFSVPDASWRAYETLLHEDLNAQVNTNRTLLSALYDSLNEFYSNANTENAEITKDTGLEAIKIIVSNAFKGIFDNSQRTSDLNFSINGNFDINFKKGESQVKLSEMINLRNQSVKLINNKVYVNNDEYEIILSEFPTFSEQDGVLSITTGNKVAQLTKK